ncbi:MAG TPA: response regulator [Longimicrobiales bacterium]|nr:response regulator [Longimicrobiales bacterium]
MSPKTVLVVDDHGDTREICNHLLTHFGYEVMLAVDGQDAVRVALGKVPDLILLDFLMPHGDGVSTLREMQGHDSLKAVPIVLYTAAATRAEELHAVEGLRRVLFKPVEVRELLAVVRELIGESEELPA